MSPLALSGVALLKVEAKRSTAGVKRGPFRFDRLRLVLARVKRGVSSKVLSMKVVVNLSTRIFLKR